jgi:hypothetical protein
MNEEDLEKKAQEVHDLEIKEHQEQMKKEMSRGLGDTIKKATDFLKIPQCGGCKERQEMLNRKFPYKKK